MEERFECCARPAFAVAGDAKAFYVGYERRNSDEECPGEGGEAAPDPTVVAKLDGQAPTPGTLIAELDHHNTTGAAVEASQRRHLPGQRSSVAAYTPEGVLIQRFGTGELTAGSGVAVDAPTRRGARRRRKRGPASWCSASKARPEKPTIDERLLAEPDAELSTSSRPDRPARRTQANTTSSTAQATAPRTPSACIDLPAGTIAAGYGDVAVSAKLDGLAPATAYYYRVLASNAHGPPKACPSPSSFRRCPRPASCPTTAPGSWSPRPRSTARRSKCLAQLRGGSIQASLDGSRLAWLAAGPVVAEPEGNRSFELSQLMSVREASGWSTTSLETPHTNGWGLLLPSPE